MPEFLLRELHLSQSSVISLIPKLSSLLKPLFISRSADRMVTGPSHGPGYLIRHQNKGIMNSTPFNYSLNDRWVWRAAEGGTSGTAVSIFSGALLDQLLQGWAERSASSYGGRANTGEGSTRSTAACQQEAPGSNLITPHLRGRNIECDYRKDPKLAPCLSDSETMWL